MLRRLVARAAIVLCAFALPALAQTIPPSAFDGLEWRLVGPLRGGWATVAAGVPDEPDTFYFGAAGGGVWKTTDAGRTWNPVSDQLPAAVGALAIAPSDSHTIYVGTGQVAPRYDIAAGEGVFKSSDGGATWRAAGLATTRHIGRILVDPRDADTVLVAALGHAFGPNPERGVFRSSDGGKTWQRTLFVSDNTGAVDLARVPNDPDVVFAATWQMRQQPWLSYFTPDVGPESGIYRSRDGGKNWQRLTGGGWPAHALGRIGLAAAHTKQGTRVYAVVDAEHDGGLWRSDDAGDHWLRVNDEHELVNGYFARLTVAPNDPDVVYAMGRSIHRCDHGGAHCEIVKGAPGGDDYHFLWINPKRPDHMITASDQGVVVSVNGGATWSSWYNQPTAQFYHLAADDRFPYSIYAGQQDSGTVAIKSRSDYGALTERDWQPIGADERDDDIPDPQDPDIVYGSGLGGRLSRWDARNGEVQNIAPWPVNSYGGRSTAFRYHYTWITPLAVSHTPLYPLYVGAQVLFRSLDRGAHWQAISPDRTAPVRDAKRCAGTLSRKAALNCGYGVIFSIGLKPGDNDEIWLGTDDGRVQLTSDGGKHWRDVTPKGIPAWTKIAALDVSKLQDGTAYIAVDNHRQDDFRPFAFRTHDYGAHWTAIAGGLPPQHFVGVVRADPVKPGLLYAGTDAGVYVSLDDGDHWQSLQRNLPTAWVRDLLVHGNDLVAATQGRAIWVLDDVTPLRQLSAEVVRSPAHLFAPATALRLRKNQNKDTPLPPEEPAGRNPPTGAMIDYWLGRDTGSPVSLEIHDAQGDLVRRFASDDKPETLRAERYFAPGWRKHAPSLATTAGAHRFAWNLRYPRPKAARYEFSIAAVWGEDTPIVPQGMLAPPGDYTVVLTAGGREYRAPLKVAADPRVALDPTALREALDLSQQVQAVLERHYNVYAEVDFVRQRLDALKKQAGAGKNARIAGDIAKFHDATDAFTGGEGDRTDNLDAIGEVLDALETDLEGSDRAPTEPQRQSLAATATRLDRANIHWSSLKAAQLPRLNARLREAGFKEIAIPPVSQIRLNTLAQSQDRP